VQELNWLCRASALEGDVTNVCRYLMRGEEPVSLRDANVVGIAVGRGDITALKVLLHSRAEVNTSQPRSGTTPLMQAVVSGNLAMVKLLLMHGANKHATSDSGLTALMLAASIGNTEIVDLLLRVGLDFDARSNTGETALMLAAKHGHIAAVDSLLEAGADSGSISDEGLTAFQYAARGNRHAIVVRLSLDTVRRCRRWQESKSGSRN